MPKKEKLTNWVKKKQKINKSFVLNEESKGSKKAVLTQSYKRFKNYSFIKVELEMEDTIKLDVKWPIEVFQ